MWVKSSYSRYTNCVECAPWTTSTYSIGNGECVEWRASTHSAGTACVEAANGIQVRDSKNPHGVTLNFDAAVWVKFTASLK